MMKQKNDTVSNKFLNAQSSGKLDELIDALRYSERTVIKSHVYEIKYFSQVYIFEK